MKRCIDCLKEIPADYEYLICRRCSELQQFVSDMTDMIDSVLTQVMESHFFYCSKVDDLMPVMRVALFNEVFTAHSTADMIFIQQDLPICLAMKAALKDGLEGLIIRILDSLAHRACEELRHKFKPDHCLIYSVDVEAQGEIFLVKLTAGWYKVDTYKCKFEMMKR